MLPAEAWRELGMHAHQGCILQNPDIFLKDFFTRYQQVPGDRRCAAAAEPQRLPAYKPGKISGAHAAMGGRRIKKLYLLMCAFINNSDTFAAFSAWRPRPGARAPICVPFSTGSCAAPARWIWATAAASSPALPPLSRGRSAAHCRSFRGGRGGGLPAGCPAPVPAAGILEPKPSGGAGQ